MLYVLSIVAIGLLSRYFGYCQINRKLVVLESLLYIIIIIGVYWASPHSKSLAPEILYFSLGMVLFGGILVFVVSIFQVKKQYVINKAQEIAKKGAVNIVVKEAEIPLVSPYPEIPQNSLLLCYNQTGFALIGSLDSDISDSFDAILHGMTGLSLQYDVVLEKTPLQFYPISGMNYLNVENCKFGAVDGSRLVSINRQKGNVIVEVFPGWRVLR